jgi:hypothetical protein
VVCFELQHNFFCDFRELSAEYKSLANATTEIIWVQSLLKELSIPNPHSAKL